jgi:3-dehydroquinate synthase
MIDLVHRNCCIKADVVAHDERESGLRGILNYGHTIGHTLETVLKDRGLHHGEAVALGIIAANRLAVKRQLLTQPDSDRITRLLQAFNLPTRLDPPIPADDLYQALLQDKKFRAGKLSFVLPSSLGSCRFVTDLTKEEILWAIRSLEQ